MGIPIGGAGAAAFGSPNRSTLHTIEGLHRAASLGLAAVLSFSATFAIAFAIILRGGLHDVSVATALNAHYQEARFEVASEESLERKYRLEPSPLVRARHAAAERSLEEAIRGAARIGGDADRSLASSVLATHAAYIRATGLMFAAVDAKKPVLVLELDGKTDPIFDNVERQVFARAARVRDETDALVAHFSGMQSYSIPLVLALAMLDFGFLVAYFIVVSFYKRRLAEAHAVEIKTLEEASMVDHLTNIGNHRSYQESLQREASRAARHNETLALALIDIDEMKIVNDENGHRHGDDVLTALGAMLRGLRPEDQPFRTGGDEFALLLPNMSGDDASAAVERVREAAKGKLFGATISVGIASLSGAACETEALQTQADAALYAAKRGGRDNVVVFDEKNDGMWLLSPLKVQQLRRLIADEAVSVAFQPIWDVERCRILAYEALARPHPAYGFPGPQEVFDLAERVGHAQEIDAVCRRATLARAKELPPDTLLFINVSPQSLDRKHFDVARLCKEVAAAGMTPQRIVVEITERSIIQLGIVIRAARELQRAGFRLALDDTGAGNAGLEMLSQLPVDFVKIDRAIIVKALTSRSARGVMAGILAIAREIDAYVIAEGIEDVAMLDLACGGMFDPAERRLGVQGVQGYLLQRPSEKLPTPQGTAAARYLLVQAQLRAADPGATVPAAPAVNPLAS
jgi:diguanylate cyclase (GGDEF)-like protein